MVTTTAAVATAADTKNPNPKSEARNPKQTTNEKSQNTKERRLEFWISDLVFVSSFDIRISDFCTKGELTP
jgi:hypothetical protein